MSTTCLAEALLMSTHIICCRGDIRKILCGYPLLSVAMLGTYPIFFIEHVTRNTQFFYSVTTHIDNVYTSCFKIG